MLGLTITVSRVEAQVFSYFWSVSPSPAAVSNTLTYTIIVTNLAASSPFYVTNTFPASAQLVGAAITSGSGTTFTNANGYSFAITLASGTMAQMTVQAMPTQAGSFTNTLVIFDSYMAAFFTTNIVTLVTNPPSTTTTNLADLTVAMTGPSSVVFSNDWMTYTVSVINLGPGTATNVLLTNSLPSGVGYKTNSLAIKPISAGSNVVFNVGTLADGDFVNLRLTVQPTNAGTWTFRSAVSTNNVNDPNLANNSASINVSVYDFFTNELVAFTNTTQTFNPQNSLMEQLITVSNAGPQSVSAARVIVLGLTNFLYNAVGTNDGNPFVVYAGSLSPGQSVNLLLQYLSPSHRTFPGPQMTALAVLPPDLSPPANLSTGIQILGISRLSSGSMLIAFPSVSNLTYTVEYSTNLLSTNWLAAQPARRATANYTQWIDYGPPGTLSHPTNSSMRFYRVFLNP